MYALRKASILGANGEKPVAQSRWRNDCSGEWALWTKGTEMCRDWFEIVRFYLLVALQGDPKERKPEARPVARAKPVAIAWLKPLSDAK